MEQILIVEDDISLNQGLCRALKSENRQIISCMNLKSTREQLLCGSVSLVLLDINLPDGNGLDFLSELKITDPLTEIAHQQMRVRITEKPLEFYSLHILHKVL